MLAAGLAQIIQIDSSGPKYSMNKFIELTLGIPYPLVVISYMMYLPHPVVDPYQFILEFNNSMVGCDVCISIKDIKCIMSEFSEVATSPKFGKSWLNRNFNVVIGLAPAVRNYLTACVSMGGPDAITSLVDDFIKLMPTDKETPQVEDVTEETVADSGERESLSNFMDDIDTVYDGNDTDTSTSRQGDVSGRSGFVNNDGVFSGESEYHDDF